MLLAEFVLLLANLIYATSYVTTRIVLVDVGPAALALARLVIGSAIIRAENPSDAYKQLYTEANALG